MNTDTRKALEMASDAMALALNPVGALPAQVKAAQVAALNAINAALSAPASAALTDAQASAKGQMHLRVSETDGHSIHYGVELIRAVERAHGIGQPPAAPVAWIRWCTDGTYEGPIMDSRTEPVRKTSGAWTPLYAAPAALAAQPLTYDQIVDALVDGAGLNLAYRSYEDDMKFARAIERAHGIGGAT